MEDRNTLLTAAAKCLNKQLQDVLPSGEDEIPCLGAVLPLLPMHQALMPDKHALIAFKHQLQKYSPTVCNKLACERAMPTRP